MLNYEIVVQMFFDYLYCRMYSLLFGKHFSVNIYYTHLLSFVEKLINLQLLAAQNRVAENQGGIAWVKGREATIDFQTSFFKHSPM